MNNKNIEEDKKGYIAKKIGEMCFTVLKSAINDETANSRVSELKIKYKALPKSDLADILIKRACRKGAMTGASSSGATTLCEAVLVAPAPEPSHKVAAWSGIVASILADLTLSVKIQMQLVLDIYYLYGVKLSSDDEDDVWLVFKMALGLSETEKAVQFGQFVFDETARKQLRKFLRKGSRKKLQDAVAKIAGEKVAKKLSEKALMRAIPVLNILIGSGANYIITKQVGKHTKCLAHQRTSAIGVISTINNTNNGYSWLTIPTMYYCSGKNDDNFLGFFSFVNNRINLSDTDTEKAESLLDSDTLIGQELYLKELRNINDEIIKKNIYQLALLVANLNQKPAESSKAMILKIASVLEIKHDDSTYNQK